MSTIGMIGIVVTALVVSSDAGVGAPANTADADDCLSAPNSPASAGRHWYYHIDWAKHRNCWYLRTQSARQTDVAPASHPVSTEHLAVATSSIANQIKQAREMITTKLGNPASIKLPDIAQGKAIDSVCGEAEAKVYIINGSDDLKASRAIKKMCD